MVGAEGREEAGTVAEEEGKVELLNIGVGVEVVTVATGRSPNIDCKRENVP
jgi:hypothetical protein